MRHEEDPHRNRYNYFLGEQYADVAIWVISVDKGGVSSASSAAAHNSQKICRCTEISLRLWVGMKALSPNSIKSTNVHQQWQPQRQYFHFQYKNRRQDGSITEACVLTRTGEQRINVKVKFYLKGVMGTFI